jgi:hypothetical protein
VAASPWRTPAELCSRPAFLPGGRCGGDGRRCYRALGRSAGAAGQADGGGAAGIPRRHCRSRSRLAGVRRIRMPGAGVRDTRGGVSAAGSMHETAPTMKHPRRFGQLRVSPFPTPSMIHSLTRKSVHGRQFIFLSSDNPVMVITSL